MASVWPRSRSAWNFHQAGTLAENELPDPGSVERLIEEEPAATHMAMVHCETTTGILNPIDEIARIVKAGRREFIVDAMSSFGGAPSMSKQENGLSNFFA